MGYYKELDITVKEKCAACISDGKVDECAECSFVAIIGNELVMVFPYVRKAIPLKNAFVRKIVKGTVNGKKAKQKGQGQVQKVSRRKQTAKKQGTQAEEKGKKIKRSGWARYRNKSGKGE